MSAVEIPLTWRHDVQDGLPTLTVRGTLTMASGELLHDAAIGFLRRHRPEVLIDLAALAVADSKAVSVLTRIVAEALQWPDVLVVVCAPTGEVTRLLGADVLDPRLVFDSVAAGRSAALATVPAVTEDLLPIAGAARRARDVITDACVRWDEPGLVGSAVLVASELVTNAAVHAHTIMTMQVRLRPCHLRIAVFDGSVLPGRPDRPAAAAVACTWLTLCPRPGARRRCVMARWSGRRWPVTARAIRGTDDRAGSRSGRGG